MPPRAALNENVPATVGCIAVLTATLMSPLCLIVPLAALIFVPMGLIGMMLCGGGLGIKRTWPGVTGLLVGGLCLSFWVSCFSGVWA